MSTGEVARGEGADKVPGYTYDIVLKTEIGERKGQLKTFMSTYDYIGAEYADENKVDVVLNSGKKRFYMTGTAVKHRD